jgi:hypothetical protein
MEAVAKVAVVAGSNPQGAGDYLLQKRKLNKIVWHPEEQIVAPHDLRPFETAGADLQEGAYVAWHVGGCGDAIFSREIQVCVPDLKDGLAAVAIDAQRVTHSPYLIQPQTTP